MLSSDLTFHIGDKVVYPNHGVGIIEQISSRTIGATVEKFYLLKIKASSLKVMQNDFEMVTDNKGHQVQQPDYEIEVIRKGEQGWYLWRKLIFRRTDLLPHRQLIYDTHGNLATDARYDDFKDYEGINFPSQIEIWRPQEEYSIILKFVKLTLNQPITDEQFALQQPAGAEVTNLDQKAQANQPEPQGSDHQ